MKTLAAVAVLFYLAIRATKALKEYCYRDRIVGWHHHHDGPGFDVTIREYVWQPNGKYAGHLFQATGWMAWRDTLVKNAHLLGGKK